MRDNIHADLKSSQDHSKRCGNSRLIHTVWFFKSQLHDTKANIFFKCSVDKTLVD